MNSIERENERWERQNVPTDSAQFGRDILPRIQTSP
jgi:hypothetical protein